ncbi:hypothetical protein ACVWXP_003078 [Bradyrhizobium sp. USDA 4463]
MLDKLPSVVTIATFSALSIAVAHEWAYFGVIGAELQSLYTSTDYIALLIWGAGAGFLFVLVMALIQLTALRADNFKLPPFSQKKTFGGFLDRNFVWVWVGGLTIFNCFFSADQVNLWFYLLLAGLVFRGLIYILRHERTRQYDQGWSAILIYGLPIGMVFSYGMGKSAAYEDLSNRSAHYQLSLKGQSVSRDVDILRLLDKGALIFDPMTRKVEFLMSDTIASITHRIQDFDKRSFACKHWNVGCLSSKRDQEQRAD